MLTRHMRTPAIPKGHPSAQNIHFFGLMNANVCLPMWGSGCKNCMIRMFHMRFWKLTIAFMLGSFTACCISWRKVYTRFRASWVPVYTKHKEYAPLASTHASWACTSKNQMAHDKRRICQRLIKKSKILKIDYFKDINLHINLQRLINRSSSTITW